MDQSDPPPQRAAHSKGATTDRGNEHSQIELQGREDSICHRVGRVLFQLQGCWWGIPKTQSQHSLGQEERSAQKEHCDQVR